MTTTEYYNKLICYLCNYGNKVVKYNTKLSIGKWCVEDTDELIVLDNLINIFEKYNLNDLPNFTTNHNSITKDQLYSIMNKIESLL